MISVTIIVPVYNVKEYIKKCLDSLINQDYDNEKVEIYIIDDASTDGTTEILEQYVQKNNNITLKKLNKNHGVSYARNLGIKMAKGQYLMFCDADDYYEKNTVSTFMNAIIEKDADFITANYFITRDSKNIKVDTSRYFSKDKIKKEEVVSYMTLTSCSKMIKKNLFYDNDIYYPEDIKRCEELTVIPILAYMAKKPIAIDNTLYHYYQRKSSASNSVQENIKYFDETFKRFSNKINKNKYAEELEFRAIEHLFYSKTLVMLKLKKSNAEIQNHIKCFKKQYPNFIKNKYLKNFNIAKKMFIYALNYKMLLLAKVFKILHEKITR